MLAPLQLTVLTLAHADSASRELANIDALMILNKRKSLNSSLRQHSAVTHAAILQTALTLELADFALREPASTDAERLIP